jgi:hypothetical protein
MTSPDGIAWTIRSVLEGIWLSVCYGNGIFVAVGYDAGNDNYRCMTSPDGITWTVSLNTGPVWKEASVCYANGLFVIAGFNIGNGLRRAWRSSDAINWKNANLSIASTDISTLRPFICSRDSGDQNSLFVVVWSDGACMTSPDGISWTERVVPLFNWHAACYGDGIFVAVGYDEEEGLGKCMTSYQGEGLLPSSATWVKIQGATTLPAGGTWAYFYFVGTTPTAGVVPGGSSVGATNAVGFAWRIY